jgi:hypothetical protein
MQRAARARLAETRARSDIVEILGVAGDDRNGSPGAEELRA